MKNDIGKWCDFHKIPWHNTDECRSKQSLVAEVKEKEKNPDSKSNLGNMENRQIIDGYPISNVATIQIQTKELVDPKEGECLFYSQMWVKGTPLHFIVDNDSQEHHLN
jgi:hypothetical protein